MLRQKMCAKVFRLILSGTILCLQQNFLLFTFTMHVIKEREKKMLFTLTAIYLLVEKTLTFITVLHHNVFFSFQKLCTKLFIQLFHLHIFLLFFELQSLQSNIIYKIVYQQSCYCILIVMHLNYTLDVVFVVF